MYYFICKMYCRDAAEEASDLARDQEFQARFTDGSRGCIDGVILSVQIALVRLEVFAT